MKVWNKGATGGGGSRSSVWMVLSHLVMLTMICTACRRPAGTTACVQRHTVRSLKHLALPTLWC